MKNLSAIPAFIVLWMTVCFPFSLIGQHPTFGDLIPDMFLPSAIHPSTPLECNRYFRVADSINNRVFSLTGVNPIPRHHCGNDSISYLKSPIEKAIDELPSGSILARMVIDRNGIPVCCKVYSRNTESPGKELERALANLRLTPGYQNGQPVPSECRFIYDFQMPQLHHRKIID